MTAVMRKISLPIVVIHGTNGSDPLIQASVSVSRSNGVSRLVVMADRLKRVVRLQYIQDGMDTAPLNRHLSAIVEM